MNEETKELFHILINILFVVVATYIIQNAIKYYWSLPPGPWGLPVVGYLPWMSNEAPHTKYLKLTEKYGDVISLKLGRDLVVCLGSAGLIREFFNRPDSVGRPHTPLNDLMEGRGIMLSEGDLWKKQRLFLHQRFLDLGVKVEKIVIMEIDELISKLQRSNGAPTDVFNVLGRHIHNVICQLTMSFRFKEGDEKFTKFNERVTEGMLLFGSIHIGEHLPAYMHLPGKAAVVKKIKRNLDEIVNFHYEHIEERQKERKSKNIIENIDLLDYYLKEIYDEENSKAFPRSSDTNDEVKQMIQVMNDLFSAGMETSLNTLAWVLVMMIREPAAAAKVREELAAVVAPGKLVTLEHRNQLLYLQAVIYETLRRVSVVPLGTTHVNSTVWKIGDYTIPKGTHIVPLINKIHMDPKVFNDPEKFMPERFLKDGKFETSDSFLAFGVGRRVCLGQQLARIELILFFANIMNRFNFSLADGEEIPPLDGVLGITHAPRPFKLCFKPIL